MDLFATYYWRVDKIDAAGAVIAGPVWSFSTIEFLQIVDTATTLTYDNTVEPFMSTLDVAAPLDLTYGGSSDRHRGQLHRSCSPHGRDRLR